MFFWQEIFPKNILAERNWLEFLYQKLRLQRTVTIAPRTLRFSVTFSFFDMLLNILKSPHINYGYTGDSLRPVQIWKSLQYVADG
jgi:hypothetical protein